MSSLRHDSSSLSGPTKRFINQGLYNWELIRRNWVAPASGRPPVARRIIPTVPTSEILTCLEYNRPFESRVPLRLMISILDDVREREGLYG